MMAVNDGRALLELLATSAKLRQPRLLELNELRASPAAARSLVLGLEGQMDLEGREIELLVGLCPRFPLALPQIFLIPRDAFGPIPHIESDGRICYRPDEGLLIDTDEPLQILEEALDAALQTVADGATGKNRTDFVAELEAYWSHFTNGSAIPSYVTPAGDLRPIHLSQEGRVYRYVADSIDQVRAFENGRSGRPTQLWQALYVPLLPTVLSERLDPHQFESSAWVKGFVGRHLSKESHRLLARHGTKAKNRAFVVLGVPRPKGGNGLIGLEYTHVSGGHPLVDGTTPQHVRLVSLERRDRDYLTTRGGAALDLSGKHVVLVGCGAIGGHLAHNLAWTGLGHLTLVDVDVLSANNTFRHVLGHSALGRRKVEALQRELTTKLPYLKVDVVRDYIELALEKRTIPLDKVDLLVYAAGDSTVGLHVNKALHSAGSGPPMLFTWLDPYGLGGHALLTNTKDEGVAGCFGCLVCRNKRGESLRNRADFAAPGQSFAKDLSGCASLFTPYADLDARRTAELAARVAVDLLRGQAIGHPLLSWKGDARQFEAAGFRLSDRYQMTEELLFKNRFAYAREDCATCGHGP